MKSTNCHKQAALLASPVLIQSNAANLHRHSHYHNKSISSRGNIKPKSNDPKNNDSSSVIIAETTTIEMPIMLTSTNRCKNNEKYSLRQRQKRSFAVPSSAATVGIMSTTMKSSEELVTTPSGDRSGFVFTTKSLSNLTPRTLPTSKEKAKSKAAPLSKYRRKTANARERTRMREINSAFENLRRCVPHTITGDESISSNEKLTKITTLRLAMKYISVLSEALDNPSFQKDFLLECQNDGDHRFSTLDWVQPTEEVIPSEEELQVEAAAASQSRSRKTKLHTTKASIKRQRTKTKLQKSILPYLTSSSAFSSSLSSSSSSAYASMSASPLLDDCHSITDLSSMILESDGESLHLSEPCLSPLSRNYSLGMQSFDGTGGLIKNTPMIMSIDSPLELSLRLEPDGDSLEFSTDQQPSSCISPLDTLESFSPFGDLLHTEFPEHSSLDLFLT